MFPKFPVFSKLRLDQRQEYDRLIKDFPPFSDTSFTNLHIWWDLDGDLAISVLNDNVVINYSLPFDPEHSGYGLVGLNEIDRSIEVIFDYLEVQARPLKLVNVPEFVVECIKHQNRYEIEEEPDFNEYIISSRELAALSGKSHARLRREVARFKRETSHQKVAVQQLDLEGEGNQRLILDALAEWESRFLPKNDPEATEKAALTKTLKNAVHLQTGNLCLFVDDQLTGFVLYHQTVEKKHFIINHLRVNYDIPGITDFMSHQIAQQALKQKVPFLNWEMDLGIEGLRQHKQSLRPVRFNRKFTIQPKT